MVHDVGVWTAKTLDFLPPSLGFAEELAPELGVAHIVLLRTICELHHGIRWQSDSVAEVVRVADRADAWSGRWRESLGAEDIDEAIRAFQHCSFHRFHRQATLKYALHRLLRPLQMFRW
ncbi:MAG: hypothetical protein ACLPR9_05260 [Acidimicrobiales bacterium]